MMCGYFDGRRETKPSVSKNPSLATSRSRKDRLVLYKVGGGQMNEV
jgi:hypothetical protein